MKMESENSNSLVQNETEQIIVLSGYFLIKIWKTNAFPEISMRPATLVLNSNKMWAEKGGALTHSLASSGLNILVYFSMFQKEEYFQNRVFENRVSRG